jgi:hypothetical protein
MPKFTQSLYVRIQAVQKRFLVAYRLNLVAVVAVHALASGSVELASQFLSTSVH